MFATIYSLDDMTGRSMQRSYHSIFIIPLFFAILRKQLATFD
ncbi:Uncharacterised protein [Serratia liquefaciens]|nr:Uncharacterised protein [Serratia liquefaciens]